jgi:hypothetical protein
MWHPEDACSGEYKGCFLIILILTKKFEEKKLRIR